MIYPAATSLMPIQISLAKFISRHGFKVLFMKYPYWYLGSTPYRYLNGPIIPGLLAVINHLLPTADLFLVFLMVVLCFWLLGGLGWYWLMQSLAKEKGLSLMTSFLFLVGPLMLFLFRFSNGLSLISFSVLPFVLLSYQAWLAKPRKKKAVICLCLLAFILLIDISILSRLVLGMMVVLLANQGWQKAEKKLKQSLLLIIWSLIMITFWYSPGFWWQILASPSFGGQSLFRVIGRLIKLLPLCLAVFLAITSGKFVKIKDKAKRFCFYWLFIFGFLTLIRFLADPDFYLDWLNYSLEIQLGLALLISLKIKKAVSLKKYSLFIWLLIYLFLSSFCWQKYFLNSFQKNLDQSLEYQLSQKLIEIVKKDETVFVSGTLVFWLNALTDLKQVRGGFDPGAVHPDWDKAAWEIREGKNVEKTIQWLKRLEIDYLLVHTAKSKEHYHDFIYPSKFEKSSKLKKIYDQDDNQIYQYIY